MKNLKFAFSQNKKDNLSPSTGINPTPLRIQERRLPINRKRRLELNKILEEKNKKIEELKQIQDRTSADLQETNNAISVLAKKLDKSTEEKQWAIAQHIERKILPLCPRLKREEKPHDSINLEVDVLTFQIKSLIKELNHGPNNLNLLTSSEIHVAALIARCSTSKQIANQLFISESTVKTHRRNIRNKLGIKNKKINLVQYLKELM